MAEQKQRTRFRPCIDIHSGVVKQIVGGSLSTTTPSILQTNYVSPNPASYYASLYREKDLTGAHVIMLGPNCEEAAMDALKAWPGGLQVGGGIKGGDDGNCEEWIERGAGKVIVTSWLFPGGEFSMERLLDVERRVGKDRLVVDVSCRRDPTSSAEEPRWIVAMNKWQTLTSMYVTCETLSLLAGHCSEFLIHAADVEGLCRGIDEDLVRALGEWVTIPTTYAGGAYKIEDLERVDELSGGKVDLTYGSALDLFGGDKVKFENCVAWNNRA
ncbi:phosphoribosylformimino-5-aminoimidazole carboxamide ribotide isomerase [Saitoella complicata NRRL Y-17804]|uniref:1-(5-phosphoribosyl)-5-[(5-phosphoribosylamino)methylideneamino] imidazole-4-carboxamide isomerase n=1 Tax=Saitoella complicata (strain BCRC 22490 / CBS 7301 / JCM 7358 / NBRC 10748 / NRRL Y-17804) TaxID=698492 RepID=A0A0E9NKZ0_SAICN|nr:phosphoribosylformimino-5-aminoimidazole carboxamide ribotide isomerase [Saitoella complicata NRRL Y-17804]ODQ54551.1 phosphoribosylformimino-5-aminoimidazole carboxamide ribotide isomerase [Saitoella complicata NRRL Y-17804]GAO50080.1 hypothetical protein G7K_4215-t1 [Saitoella complicata NRRL Y-17804]